MPPPAPDFDWRFAVTLVIPAVIVMVGWFLVHWLAARRDLASRKREARLKALETAYLRLAKAGNSALTEPLMDEIELFVSEVVPADRQTGRLPHRHRSCWRSSQ